jgi:ParB-like chromosome segregation protein Spo0J
MQMQTNNITRKLSELRPHPASLKIYGKNEDVKDLVESIRANGLLVPLTVKPDGVILSGNRRYKAAVELGLEEVPCVTAEPQSPEEEEIFIIEANRNRKKDVYQLYNEGVRLKAAYAALDGRKQRYKTNDSSESDEKSLSISAESAEIAQAKQPVRKTCSTSAAVASAIGMKDRTWQRLEHIANLAEMGNETAAELLQRINNEDLSLFKAERILRQSLKVQAANGEPEREKTMFDVCLEQAEKSSKELLRALEKLVETPDEDYNSFRCDCLRDRLECLSRAFAKLDEKEEEHSKVRKTRTIRETGNNKEDAA